MEPDLDKPGELPMIPTMEPMMPTVEPMMTPMEPMMPTVEPMMAPTMEPMMPPMDPMMPPMEPMMPTVEPMMPSMEPMMEPTMEPMMEPTMEPMTQAEPAASHQQHQQHDESMFDYILKTIMPDYSMFDIMPSENPAQTGMPLQTTAKMEIMQAEPPATTKPGVMQATMKGVVVPEITPVDIS